MNPSDQIIDVEPIRNYIIACPRCGRKNRISTEPGVQFRCGECRYIFSNHIPNKWESLKLLLPNIKKSTRLKFLFLATSIILVLTLFNMGLIFKTPTNPAKSIAPTPSISLSTPRPPMPPAPVYRMSLVDPYGDPWPSKAAYLRKSNRSNTRGYCKVIIDNSQNDSPIHGKFVWLTKPSDVTVREYYIPAHSKFTMKKIKPEVYDIRYISLIDGNKIRTEPFKLEEIRNNSGVEYSVFVITLYKVPNGNLHTYPITNEDFFNLPNAPDEMTNL